MIRCAPLALLLLLVLTPPMAATEPPADLVLVGGTIRTLDPAAPVVEALAARDGFIVAIGTAAAIREWIGPDTRFVDLAGAVAIPGLEDAHMHLAGVGEELLTLNLKGTTSLDDLLARVATHAERLPEGEWVSGRGWIETFWDTPRFPTRDDLDRVCPDRPVYLTRVDGHGAVVNSRALEIAGVTADTPDPTGGQILRDADGRATGMLLDHAMSLAARHLPPPGKDRLRTALVLGAEEYARRGWTAVQIAGGSWRENELLESLVAAGEIPIRIVQAVYGPGPDAERFLEAGPVIAERGGRYTRRTIKVSFDGALGSGGAALLEDYADREGNGFLKYPESDLVPLYEAALRKGIQVQVHAIGDRANRSALDIYERVFRTVPPEERAVREPRWRIEHAQILDAADIPRFAALGVIPSMQPSHAITDLHFAPSRLGVDRLAGAYAWKPLIESGAWIAGGSDAPVEAGLPMVEFYAAVARRDLKGFRGEGWHPELAVDRPTALRMLTEWPARAVFQESWRGRLAAGYACDVTVLSADPLTVAEAEIPGITVVSTIVHGEVVYRASDPERPESAEEADDGR